MRQKHSARHLLWRGAVALVGGVGIATGLYPVAPQVALAVARRRSGRPQPPHVARAIAREWALSVALQAARPAGFAGVVMGRQAHGPRPVVLLHGYGMSRANFLVLAARLRKAGLGPLAGFEYWTLGHVEQAAGKLARFVDALCRHTGAREVDLVGHSMGGVVARAYVALHGGAGRVRNLVTIGSPHRGSPVAQFGIGWPAVELQPGSDLLARLRAAPIPEGTRVTCIWSHADGMVSSIQHARMPGAEELVYEDLGHLSLLCSRRVARELAARLKR